MKWSHGLGWALMCSALGACAGEPAVDNSCGGQAPYANPGPYAVGVMTLQQDGAPVEVWYPAQSKRGDKDVYDLRDWLDAEIGRSIPDEEAPRFTTEAYRDAPVLEDTAVTFPLVLFSHGLGGYRAQSTFFTTHLASWGFVVIAPDHPERGLQLLISPQNPDFEKAPQTLRGSVEVMRAENDRAEGPFFGRIDLGRVAATGHSAGGATANAVAVDEVIKSWVGHAGSGQARPQKPALLLAGDSDDTVPAASIERTWNGLDGASPQRFLSIFGAGHLAFSDICLIAQEQGGLIPLARKYGIEVPVLFETLATDGCNPGELGPERAWPVINHYSTAHLFETLQVPGAQPGFTEEARACFEPLVLQFSAR